jgi:hypothetical protein
MKMGENFNYNFTLQPDGWSGKLSGTYKGKQIYVNYLGDTSQFPLGPIEVPKEPTRFELLPFGNQRKVSPAPALNPIGLQAWQKC